MVATLCCTLGEEPHDAISQYKVRGEGMVMFQSTRWRHVPGGLTVASGTRCLTIKWPTSGVMSRTISRKEGK